jgi:hypothetical protein
MHPQAQLGAAVDLSEPGGGGAGDYPEQLLEALDVKVRSFRMRS